MDSKVIIGVLTSIIVGGILYWMKDAWDSRKEKIKEHEVKMSVLENKILIELKKISDNFHSLDKDFSTQIAGVDKSVSLLTESTHKYQKDLTKLEGKIEAVLKSQEEHKGDVKVNNSKFERIFQYIDSKPDKYPNIQKDIG